MFKPACVCIYISLYIPLLSSLFLLTNFFSNDFGKLLDGVFLWVAKIDGEDMLAVHQFYQTIYQVTGRGREEPVRGGP